MVDVFRRAYIESISSYCPASDLISFSARYFISSLSPHYQTASIAASETCQKLDIDTISPAMIGTHQSAGAVAQILPHRSPDEQQTHQDSCTGICINGISLKRGEVLYYVPNPSRGFNGPSNNRCNGGLGPHFVVILRRARANEGKSPGSHGEPEYMCCVVYSLQYPPKECEIH